MAWTKVTKKSSNYTETSKGTSNWAKEKPGWFHYIGWFSSWFGGKITSSWTETSKS